MQSLAAYSFETSLDDVDTRLRAVDDIVDEWLRHKGAELPRVSEGSFVSKTGDGTGQFLRHLVESPVGNLREIELVETAHNGSMFTTSVQVASVDKRIVVFASLQATPGESRIAPVNLYPRCPWVIRAMIERFHDWKFADQEVPLAQAFDAKDPKSAQALCDKLRSNTRRFPVVVVSNDEDEAVWPNLHLKVAEHLVGLANVAVVSAESSWVLTDELGPRDSCYLGAVRLYWPARRPDGSIPGIKWLAPRMAALGTDDSGRNKLLAILRREIMSVAALTMFPPVVFKEIRQAAERQRLQSLEAGERDRELDSIIAENSKLTDDLDKAQRTIQSLQWKLASAAYASREVRAANDDAASDNTEEPDQRTPPQAGETRYYKKIGSGGGVDSLVQTKPCQHKESNWRPAFKGDQAEKGLLKLEGSNDWRSIAHCSACTGGGRWRVNW
ncbi:hypothetical protein [Burkholderia gladioli]|uniref:hypothetical protein n=1 Tax=Burkholderia gladioli TaxID=28095 RepID=UPI001642064D|nr:hypothetical protein [Burkholderia gladioli]